MSGAAVFLASQQHADPHAGSPVPPERDEHPLAPTDRGARYRRRPSPAMQQGIDDGVDLFDPAPGNRPQQRRHVGVRAHADRDEDLALLDVRVGQVADLCLDPAALAGVGREHNQPVPAFSSPSLIFATMSSPGPIIHLSSQTSIPRSHNARASASTAGLSFDEWLMKTAMSASRAAAVSASQGDAKRLPQRRDHDVPSSPVRGPLEPCPWSGLTRCRSSIKRRSPLRSGAGLAIKLKRPPGWLSSPSEHAATLGRPGRAAERGIRSILDDPVP